MFRKGTRWKHVLQAALTFNSFYVESTYPIKRIRFLKLTNLASVWGKRECSAFPRNSSVLMNAFKWLHGDMQVLVLYCLGPQNQVASATAKQCYTIPIHWPCHIGHQPPALIVFIIYTFSAVTYRNKNKKIKETTPVTTFQAQYIDRSVHHLLTSAKSFVCCAEFQCWISEGYAPTLNRGALWLAIGLEWYSP